VVLAALFALVVIVTLCIVKIVQGDGNGVTGAVSLVTANGAILTGLVGTFFGVNVARRPPLLRAHKQKHKQQRNRPPEQQMLHPEVLRLPRPP
jgi:hypothetical protein